MLGVTIDPYSTSIDVWPAHKVFFSRRTKSKGCVNHDSSNSAIEAQNLNNPTPR